MRIDIETLVKADLDTVWQAWNTPADICAWNAASDDWHTTDAKLELEPGGSFCYRMAAKDGSFAFDFSGIYTFVAPMTRIEFELDDSRIVSTTFESGLDGVHVRQSFEAADEMSASQQKDGWQAILNNFARHVESKVGV
ncbi:MAG: SRPBCC domain-containing protein [Kordiimonadaceae bacterium]|nr:SRPBCC domain-containing protein [Kordiimonadaceae bacterium]